MIIVPPKAKILPLAGREGAILSRADNGEELAGGLFGLVAAGLKILYN
ncbi:MAG: hypothetical protein MZV64_27715 [Ignavibacteriales bacterium]|nr:hypothetical protein [Ignavibacteriales bacterium]